MRPPYFSKCAIEVLKAFPWKGNVRELGILQETLHYTKGNKKKAAEILDISRKAFYNKLKQNTPE